MEKKYREIKKTQCREMKKKVWENERKSVCRIPPLNPGPYLFVYRHIKCARILRAKSENTRNILLLFQKTGKNSAITPLGTMGDRLRPTLKLLNMIYKSVIFRGVSGGTQDVIQ